LNLFGWKLEHARFRVQEVIDVEGQLAIRGNGLRNVTEFGSRCPLNETGMGQEAEQGPKKDALSCAVRADDRQIFSASHCERQILDDDALSECYGEIAYREHPLWIYDGHGIHPR
jgi:hypothetical protein